MIENQKRKYRDYEYSVDTIYNNLKKKYLFSKLTVPSEKQIYDFNDPATITFWLEDYSVDTCISFKENQNVFDFDYLSLRKKQNKQWALNSSMKGHLLSEKKEFNSAMRMYQSALEMDPECVEAFVGRASVMIKAQELEDAILQENLAVGMENIGITEEIVKKLAIAIDDIKKALKFDPHHSVAKALYTKMKAKSLQQEEMRAQLEQGEFLLPIGVKPSEARKLNVFEAVGPSGKDI